MDGFELITILLYQVGNKTTLPKHKRPPAADSTNIGNKTNMLKHKRPSRADPTNCIVFVVHTVCFVVLLGIILNEVTALTCVLLTKTAILLG
jgi:hypothetical protein